MESHYKRERWLYRGSRMSDVMWWSPMIKERGGCRGVAGCQTLRGGVLLKGMLI